MKRGKPHKQETQILVGELKGENEHNLGSEMIDKYLSPIIGTEHGLLNIINLEELWKI